MHFTTIIAILISTISLTLISAIPTSLLEKKNIEITPRDTPSIGGPMYHYGTTDNIYSTQQIKFAFDSGVVFAWYSLSPSSFAEWASKQTHDYPTRDLPQSDPLCSTSFICPGFTALDTPVLINGTTIQVSKSNGCGGAPSCNSGVSTAETIGWSESTSVGIDFGVVNFGATYTVSESTTTAVINGCNGGTGQTVCQRFTPFFYSASFGCQLQGYYCGKNFCSVADLYAWRCPAAAAQTFAAPVSAESGSDEQGIFLCGINEECEGYTP